MMVNEKVSENVFCKI